MKLIYIEWDNGRSLLRTRSDLYSLPRPVDVTVLCNNKKSVWRGTDILDLEDL